jgi:alpha-amylase/alpha-mannosidase (GH57 family)
MNRYICIHGHFYQPPRENPWLEAVELQDSAYPFHDWNEKIAAECYAPNTASRILDQDGRIIDIVNNYSKISFNFGPTLLFWMERHRPEVYQAILDADRLSMERFSGHGSAIAQVYNHMIMPLANLKDKYTQIIWGIKDFQYRFKRFPEGMWLPETAVDVETLRILADLGIKFTILAPRQARRVRKIGRGSRWQDVTDGRVDPTMPYRFRVPSGKSIAIFFYDGPISQDVAFSGLLYNGEEFAKRLLAAFTESREWPQIVHIATDGETYGHHHRGGDMALAYCLYFIESNNLAQLTNYGEYLEKHPPTYEVEIFENSSWSCIHGVERWKGDCGCNSGMNPGWTQQWRGPLRESLDMLRNTLIPFYEKESAKYLKKPWKARDEYISVINDRTRDNIEAFIRKHSIRELSRDEQIKVLKLLEMQRNAMLMYASCGWFFDEISGIESVQVMQYASRVMQLAKELFDTDLESDFLSVLKKAPSNIYENAAVPYEMFVKPARLDLMRVSAHYSISSIFENYPEEIKIYCYTAKNESYNIHEAGKQKLVTGKVHIISDITWDEKIVNFVVLHLGDHNINAGVKEYVADNGFSGMLQQIEEAFSKGDIPDVIRLIDNFFGEDTYTIRHLFRDQQRKVIDELMQLTYEEIDTSYRNIYENNYAIMNFFRSLSIPVSKAFTAAAEHVMNIDLKKVFEDDIDIEKLKALIGEVEKWSLSIDKTAIGFVASKRINLLMENLLARPDDIPLIEKINNTLELLNTLLIELDLWKAQNIYFSIANSVYKEIKEKLEKFDSSNEQWLEAFRRLGYYLRVKVAL